LRCRPRPSSFTPAHLRMQQFEVLVSVNANGGGVMAFSFRARLSLITAALTALTALTAGATPAAAARPAPVRLIIDTDFGQWWDDVAALAAAHAAADRGAVRLLGVMSDVDNPWNADALDALNTWYGRPELPIGVTAGAIAVEQNYSRLLAENFPHRGRAEDSL